MIRIILLVSIVVIVKSYNGLQSNMGKRPAAENTRQYFIYDFK